MKRISILSFIIFYLFSIAGILLTHHICNMSGADYYRLYSSQDGRTCCSENTNAQGWMPIPCCHTDTERSVQDTPTRIPIIKYVIGLFHTNIFSTISLPNDDFQPEGFFGFIPPPLFNLNLPLRI